MAKDIEIVRVSTAFTGDPLPTSNAVIGSTADTGMSVTIGGVLRRTVYKAVGGTAASTWSLSTAAYINTLTVIPISTGAGVVTLLDGSTAIVSIPAAAHAVDAAPYTLNFGGITNVSSLGFKIVTGTSVQCLISGAFFATPTTA
jgi:hypothetical protein